MKITKTTEKIVCDATGCGKLAEYEIIFSTGARYFMCADCLKEAAKALKEIKKSE